MNVYAFVVKSTGHNMTLPEETAVLLDNDIDSTCKKGRKHINAVADNSRTVNSMNTFLDGDVFIFMLLLPKIFYTLRHDRQGYMTLI